MGVAPGRTTVIAATETGTAIVQYDVTVTPGAGSQSPAASPAAAAGIVTLATALAIQAAIARTVQGASGVTSTRRRPMRSSPGLCRTL